MEDRHTATSSRHTFRIHPKRFDKRWEEISPPIHNAPIFHDGLSTIVERDLLTQIYVIELHNNTHWSLEHSRIGMGIPALRPNETAHIPERPIHQASFWPKVAGQENSRTLAKKQIRFQTFEILIEHQLRSRTLLKASMKGAYAQDGLLEALSQSEKLLLVHLGGTIFPLAILSPAVHKKRRLLKC